MLPEQTYDRIARLEEANKLLHEQLDSAREACRVLQITLRDQFAMAALTGLTAAESKDNEYSNDQSRADHAYRVAHAIIRARAI